MCMVVYFLLFCLIFVDNICDSSYFGDYDSFFYSLCKMSIFKVCRYGGCLSSY